MAITTVDGIVAAAKQQRPYYKPSLTAKAAAAWQSIWTAAGMPGAGAAAGSAAGAACDNTTAGALPWTSPGGANTAYLAALEWACTTAGVFFLADRLVHTSALSGIVTTAQTVGSAALTRYTTGEDVECWLEIYAATGATAVTATVSYTNEAGTAGRTGTASIVATTVAGQMFPVALQSGDKGVRSVQSVTLSASTLTAGNFGITLLKRLATMNVLQANSGGVLDFGGTGLPQVQAGACLSFLCLASTTSTGILTGVVKTAEG
jgi:hypothetical protein